VKEEWNMFLALREMRHSRAKYLMIAVIMLLISFLVLFVTGLAKGLSYANISALENMKANGFVVQDTAEGRFRSSQLSESDLKAVREVTGGQKADYLGVQSASIAAPLDGKKLDVTLFAVDMDGSLAPKVVEGSPLTNTAAGSIIADNKLKEKGILLGDAVTDSQTGLSFVVSGFTENSSYSHMPVVYMNGLDWMKIKTSGGKSSPELSFNAIAVTADSDALPRLETQLPGLELLSKNQAVSSVPGYSAEQGSLTMMIVFLYVISAIVLSVFFYVLTIQKTVQLGILKAMGIKPLYLSWSVVAQVLVLSAVSLAASLTLTGVTAAALPASMPFHMDWKTMLLSGILFLGVALVGSLLSVWQVGKVDALEAIGRVGA
jgi:putative ABC transport system permease protein